MIGGIAYNLSTQSQDECRSRGDVGKDGEGCVAYEATSHALDSGGVHR